MPLLKMLSRMSCIVSVTGIFVYEDLISKLYIKLLSASGRVRKVLAKSYDFFKIYGFTANWDIRGTSYLPRIKFKKHMMPLSDAQDNRLYVPSKDHINYPAVTFEE